MWVVESAIAILYSRNAGATVAKRPGISGGRFAGYRVVCNCQRPLELLVEFESWPIEDSRSRLGLDQYGFTKCSKLRPMSAHRGLAEFVNSGSIVCGQVEIEIISRRNASLMIRSRLYGRISVLECI